MGPIPTVAADTRLFDLGPLGGLGFAVLLFLVASSLGERILRLLGAGPTECSALERILASSSLGIGVVQLLVFGLGLAHQFRARALGLLFLLLLALAAQPVGGIVRTAAASAVAAWRSLSALPRVAVSLVGLAVLLKLPAALSPVTDLDGLWYHVAAPQRWLELGYLAYLPTLNMTLWPMGTEMLYGLGLVFSEAAPKATHFMLGCLLILSIYALGRRLYGRVLGFVASVGAVLVYPGTTMTIAYNDASISFHVTCAFLVFAIWLSQPGRAWLWTAALISGVATCSKLTGAPLGVLLGVAAVVLTWRRDRDRWAALYCGAVFVALTIAPTLPFFARAGLLTGNPVYPFLSNLIPTRDWNPAAGKVMDQFFKYLNWGQDRAFSMSTRVLIHHVAAGGGALLGLLGFWHFRKRPEAPLLAVLGVLLVVFLWSAGPYTRFMLPLISVGVVFVLAPVYPRLVNRQLRVGVSLVVALAAFAQSSRSLAADEVRVAVGALDRQAFLDQRIPLHPIWTYVNARLPPEAALLLYFPGAYYIRRTSYIVDPLRDQFIHYDTWQHFRADLKQHNICYVIAPQLPIRVQKSVVSYAPLENAPVFLSRLITESGRELTRSGDSALHALELDFCLTKPTSTTRPQTSELVP